MPSFEKNGTFSVYDVHKALLLIFAKPALNLFFARNVDFGSTVLQKKKD